jgi:hypothetical protein
VRKLLGVLLMAAVVFDLKKLSTVFYAFFFANINKMILQFCLDYYRNVQLHGLH